MDFYQKLSQYYDEIFPLNQKGLAFLEKVFSKNHKILDVGCGTGSMSLALLQTEHTVTSIDLDNHMLQVAREKDVNQCGQFIHMDMNDIDQKFGAESFDHIICLGNTLVHLGGKDEIGEALSKMHRILRPNGNLIIQIVNFDRVFDQKEFSLPLIDRENVVFERKYRQQAQSNRLEFITRIVDKKTNHSFENHASLYPLRKQEFEELLIQSDFNHNSFYGNYDDTPFSNGTPACIVVATKHP